MVTNPLSANQIVDVPVDLKCLTVNCPTLPNVLQAIIDNACETEEGLDGLDLRCVVSADRSLQNVLQGIINALDCSGGGGGGGGSTSTDVSLSQITGLNNCTTDNWDCSSANACFTLTDPCNPGTITLRFLIQMLIDRNVAYGNTIKTLCARVSTLESQIATIQTQITTIQTSCC